MNKPKYLVVTPFFPSPHTWRGAFCYDFVRALIRTNKYEVIVMASGDGVDYQYHDVLVHSFVYLENPCGLMPWMFERKNKNAFLKKLHTLGLSPKDIAICHGHTKEFAIYPLAIKESNPLCLTLLHHHISSPLRLYAGRFGAVLGYTDMLYLWVRKLCDQIDCHVPCSQQVADTYARVIQIVNSKFVEKDLRTTTLFGKLLPALKDPKQIVFYNGYDDTIFYPDRVSHLKFTIGFVGNFNNQKRPLTLLRAIRILKDRHADDLANWSVRMVGSGPLMGIAQNYVTEHTLNDIVVFETEVDHTQLPKFYNSIDLFVLPSAFEGFCCVYMEAFGCGTPFIATRGVSTEEVISAECKDEFLVTLDNPEELADRIWKFYMGRPTLKLNQPMRYDDIMASFVVQVEELRKNE